MRAGLAYGAATGGRLRADGLAMDPVMSALVRFVRRLPGPPEAAMTNGAAAMRSQYAGALRLTGLRADPLVAMRTLAVPGAAPDVPAAREYRAPGHSRGTLLYFHGGGFIMGSPATHDGLCRRLALRTGLLVVSAGYRLAPEHPFPAAHEDAAAALAWVRSEAGAHESGAGGNGAGALLVGGDSAGANLAASLAREGGVDGQVLLYPVVDMLDAGPEAEAQYASLTAFADGYLLTAAGMEQCAQALVPDGQDRGDARLSPIRADLSRAAPALVVVAGFDPLRDQGRAYAAALRAAGRAAELLEEPALVHGFADFAGVVPAARRAVDRLAAGVREMA